MDILLSNRVLPFVVAGAMALVLGLLLILLRLWWANNSLQKDLGDQIDDILSGDEIYGTDAPPQITLMGRWNNYWGTLLQDLGVKRYAADKSGAGREVAIILVVSIVLVGVITGNFILGLAAPIVLAVGFSMFARMKANAQEKKLNTELPGFLNALKSNLQANETPERAIVKVVDQMPEPLKSNLMVIRNRVLAGDEFAQGLRECQAATSSRDLKFLCACLIQAAGLGTNLESQIVVIQEVLDSRRKVADALNTAVNSAKPAMIISSVCIPAVFLWTWTSDPAASAFWFSGIISWVAFFGFIALWAVGMFLTKKMIDGIRNL